jgi:hypothetical protein
MDPAKNGVVLAAEPVGPGGRVISAISDQGEGQEPLTGAGMFSLEGQATQVLERLSPLLHLDTDHHKPSSWLGRSSQSPEVPQDNEANFPWKLLISGRFWFSEVFVGAPRGVVDVPINNRQPFPSAHSAYWANSQTWQAIGPALPRGPG